MPAASPRHWPRNSKATACPNGCAQPYLAEIALAGKAPGRYNLMLGGDQRGQRLNTLYRENIDETATLDPLFQQYAAERTDAERFGDFLLRANSDHDVWKYLQAHD